MGIFSRFSRRGTGSSTASETRSPASPTQRTRGAKIETFQADRPHQGYAGDPQDMDHPEFTRTGSYVRATLHMGIRGTQPTLLGVPVYVASRDTITNSLLPKHQYQSGTDDEPNYKYLQASDVRRQVQQAPVENRSVGKYPNPYYNKPPQPLVATPPWSEFPIAPSPRDASRPAGNFVGQGPPGPIRALYNNRDRTVFDVAYHDKTRKPGPPALGKKNAHNPYSLAKYHPAPTYTDTSSVRR